MTPAISGTTQLLALLADPIALGRNAADPPPFDAARLDRDATREGDHPWRTSFVS